MGKSLYAIQEDYVDIIRDVEENDGELTADIESALAINEEEREAKALAYIQRIDEETAFIDRVSKEITRLTKMKKTKQNLVDRLKGTLVDSVILFGEYNTGLYKVGTRTSQSINVFDEKSVPSQFKTTEEKVKVDKTAIKRAINAGDEIEGAELLENVSLSLGSPK